MTGYSRLLEHLKTLVAGFVAAAVLVLPAHGQVPDGLTGWWLAIDESMPSQWSAGTMVTLEEVLIVSSDGRVENRVMTFFGSSADACAHRGECSDAPLAATARSEITEDQVSFLETVPEEDIGLAIPDPEFHDSFRSSLVTGLSQWSYTVAADGDLLTLTSPRDSAIRQFARITPDRLRLLRRGFLELGRSASEHWRCYLGNAMAGDPAFAALESDPAAVPNDFDDFIHAAGYIEALRYAAMYPVPDDPNRLGDTTKMPAMEFLLVPQFDDIALPASAAEREALQERFVSLMRAIPQEERAGDLPLTDAQIDAYMAARTLPPAYAALLCI